MLCKRSALAYINAPKWKRNLYDIMVITGIALVFIVWVFIPLFLVIVN